MTATTTAIAPVQLRHRGDIDGLRALAIVLVVLYHAGYEWVPGGFVGVDVFFVLSGFLITSVILRDLQRPEGFSYLEFFARRGRRLLPMSALTLVGTVTAGMLLLPPLAREGLLRDAQAASLYVANWRFAGLEQQYTDTAVTDALLMHFWSLSVEEQFYFVWPVVLLGGVALAARTGKRSLLPVLLAAVVVASFATSVVMTGRLGAAAYYVTHLRIWEMGLGGFLAASTVWRSWFARPAIAGVAVPLGVALILWSALSFDSGSPYPGASAVVPVLGTALIVCGGAQGGGRMNAALSTPTMQAVGRWSYSWYLLHWPALGFASLLLLESDEETLAGAPRVAALAASLVAAAAAYRMVENPLRHAKWLSDRRRSLLLGGTLTAVPVILAMSLLAIIDLGQRGIPAGTEASPMSPQSAAEDLVTLLPADCNRGSIALEGDPLECALGDPNGSKTILVAGDSHAQHWLPALDAAGRERGWRVLGWTLSSCAVVDVRQINSVDGLPHERCHGYRDDLLKAVEGGGNIDLVIIGRSYRYTEMLIDDDGRPVLDGPTVLERWGDGTQRMSQRLTAAGVEVLFLEDTPWSPVDVPTCLSQHGDEPSACSFGLAEAADRDRELVAVEAEVLTKIEGASQADWTRLVCPQDPCAVITDRGTITHRDRHHLTQTYSRELGDAVGEALVASHPGLLD